MDVGIEIADLAVERYFGAGAGFEQFALLEEGLGLLLVLPEIRVAYFFFERGELGAGGRGVKDNSGRARRAFLDRRNGAGCLRCVQAWEKRTWESGKLKRENGERRENLWNHRWTLMWEKAKTKRKDGTLTRRARRKAGGRGGGGAGYPQSSRNSLPYSIFTFLFSVFFFHYGD